GRVGIVQVVVIEIVVGRELPPAVAVPIDAAAALVVVQNLPFAARRKAGITDVRAGDVREQVLRGLRPGSLRNQRIWEYALRGRGAPGRVVRLIRRDRVAELLRQQVRKIRAPDVVANKRRSIVQQVSVAICHRRNGDQPGIDTLALARALEIAEEKQLVLFDRTADRSTKLVLAIEAAFRREKVSGIERGVSQELKSASVNLIGTRLGD